MLSSSSKTFVQCAFVSPLKTTVAVHSDTAMAMNFPVALATCGVVLTVHVAPVHVFTVMWPDKGMPLDNDTVVAPGVKSKPDCAPIVI